MYAEDDNNEKWPEAVLERLKAYAERLGISVGEAANQFKAWLKEEFQVDNLDDEDEYLLTEWAEMFVIETRNLGASGGSSRATTTYVGTMVAIEDSSRDMRESTKDKAVNLFKSNADRAISEKVIGIVTAKEGNWCINGEPTGERVDGSELPWFAFEQGDLILTLLNTNAASNNVGKPMAPTSFSRNLYFLGSEEKSNVIQMWRVSLSGKAMDADYTFYEPCKVQAIPPTQAGRDTLYTNRNFHETVEYTDSFVPENLRAELRPERLLVNDQMHKECVDLSELVEVHSDRKIQLANGNTLNPVVITKGYVSRLNKEPMASEYDSTGRSFRMSITSLALQSRNGRDSPHSEVTVWVPGAMYDNHHPFEFQNVEGNWVPYAERTPVIIVGRLKLRPYNNETLPSLTALGIFVPPRTARPAATGGNTSLGQFGGDQ
jgi:hypothetical protein